MKRAGMLIGLFSGLAFAGCADPSSSAETADKPVDKRVVQLFGGQQSVQNLAAPTKIEAFRIDGAPKVRPPNEPPKPLGGYPVISGPIKVDAAIGKELAAILLDADVYEWDNLKACEFEPGVALRFTKVGPPTEVLLCFGCDQMEAFRDGKRVGGTDDDAARGPLLLIVKRLFPRDAKIQELKSPEELSKIRHAEVRKQIEQQRYAANHMHPSVRQALEDDPFGFEKVLKRVYPTTDKQILALLEFEGSTSNWSSFARGQQAVRMCLEKYSLEELEEPVRTALLGDNRRLRRGAVRLCETERKLASWKPEDRAKLYAARLDVLFEEPDYARRQGALERLVAWATDLDPTYVDRTLDKALHDAEAGVRRSAMIAAGMLRHQRSVPVLLEILEGRAVATRPAPMAPKEEKDYSPFFVYDVFADKRPEPEVAAVALGLMGHAPAVATIEARSDKSPMYEVALALLGQPERLKPEYFNGTHPNKELQLGAVEAVVRCKGRYGLSYAVHYKSATHGIEWDIVLDQLRRMLLAEKAPGSEVVTACKNMAGLEAWYEKYGDEYLASLKPPAK